MTPATVIAHGVGGRQDLPIPFSLAVAGAAAALVVSFLVLRMAWRQPRFRGDQSGRPLPLAVSRAADSSWTRWALRLLGLVAAAYVTWGAVAGPDLADPHAPRQLAHRPEIRRRATRTRTSQT